METNLAIAIKKFKKIVSEKSFSGRHPELGKMVNCAICGLRHRSSKICQQRHVVDLKILPYLMELTPFQRHGRASFKKRINPHYSKKRLQLLQLTRDLFLLHKGQWPSTKTKSAELVAMQMARREARELLEDRNGLRRAKLQNAQHRSRRVNNGLIPGNQASSR